VELFVSRTSHFQGKKFFTQLQILMDMQGTSAEKDNIIYSSSTMPSGGTIASYLVFTRRRTPKDSNYWSACYSKHE